MTAARSNPRILIVTPEVTYLPDNMGNIADYLKAKAGGMADVSAALVSALFDQGADVHVALPNYRAMFNHQLPPVIKKNINTIRRIMPGDRIHLAEDGAFFYMNRVYSNYGDENMKISLAFQREVINNIVPRVRPDLIHCNDWMTGLIPAMARQAGIHCLFTIHNIYSMKSLLAHIEESGIDSAYFWQHLFYERMGYDCEGTRETNPVDLLVSGVFAAHFVNTVSPTFLRELIEGRHDFVEAPLKQELAFVFDSNGLSWAIDEAIKFYNLNLKIKKNQIERVMTQSTATFSHAVTARQYIDLYEKMLARPLVKENTISP